VRGDGAAGAGRVALELLGRDGHHSFRAVDGAVVEDLVHVERLSDEAEGVPATQLEVLAREAVVRVGAGGVGRRLRKSNLRPSTVDRVCSMVWM